MVHNDKPMPIFGILTVADEERQFRGNRNNFIDIIRTGREAGIDVYVVTVSDLNLARRTAVGYRYDFSQKSWQKLIISLPRVLYNRIPQREDELRPEVSQVLKACLKHPDIRLFNPAFFNKWSLFKWLRQSKMTRQYTPSTRKFSDRLKLKEALQKYPLLYLKPEKGKAGRGIMKAQYFRKTRYPYVLTIQDKKSSRTFKFRTLNHMRKKIKEHIGDEDYIVQQGIELASYKDRPFDLRILVQKNIQGKWSITGIGARVAGSLSITTHVPRGGSIDDPKRLLTNVFGPVTAKKILLRVKKAALSIARQIERGSGRRHGEMSIDIGVDKSGHVWFFEANSKPMKFDEPEIRRKSLQKLIEYGYYLYTRSFQTQSRTRK